MLHREQDLQDMEAIKEYRHTEARKGLCDSEELQDQYPTCATLTIYMKD